MSKSPKVKKGSAVACSNLLDQRVANVLNVLIWKLGAPAGYPADANAIAGYIIAELADKHMTGLMWDMEAQEFIVSSSKD